MEKSKIKIELLNDVDINEITANLEYCIVIIGQQGKFLMIIY